MDRLLGFLVVLGLKKTGQKLAQNLCKNRPITLYL